MKRPRIHLAHGRPPVDRLRLRTAPLAATAVCFALGILLAHLVAIPSSLLAAGLASLAVLTVLALLWAPGAAVAAVAALWLALGAAAATWQPAPAPPRQLLGFADGLSRTVVGRVMRLHRLPAPANASEADQVPPWEMSEAAPTGSGAAVEDRLSLDLDLDAIEDVTPDRAELVPASGGVRITVYAPPPELDGLACGDRIYVPLRLRAPDRYRDPGAFDYGAYLLAHDGIALRSSVAGASVVRAGHAAATWRCRLYTAQGWAAGRLTGFIASAENRRLPALLRLDAEDGAMLNAMLFGDRSGLTHGLRLGFERTGTFHLFVVSGLHVALLAGAVFWLLGRVPLPFGLRVPPWLRALSTLAITLLYAAFTGLGAPAQRALAMVAVLLLARLLHRERDSLNALGAAVLVMLVADPASLFDTSLQMTVLVIVAIAGIAIPLGRWTVLRYAPAARDAFRRPRADLAPREAQFRLMLELWGDAIAALLGEPARRVPATAIGLVLNLLELALTGIVAELVLVLPMAMYFHRAAVFALPANMLVLPLIGLLAPAAVATFACALLNPWPALLPGAITALLLHGITYVVGHLGRAQGADVRMAQPLAWVAAIALAAWAICCWAVRRSRPAALIAALALPLVAACILWPAPPRTTPGALELTALDIGQGDSLLAVSPGGQTMLVDAGGPVGSHGVAEIVSNFDVGEQVVSPYLWTRRIRRLDVVVLSHAHSDHMGGMPAVLDNFRPRELWLSSAQPASPLLGQLLAQAARLGVRVRRLHTGDHLTWGGAEVEVLSPSLAYANPGAPRNDDSLVLDLRYGKASMLLEGDAEHPSEDTMLAEHLVQPVTLLKVGHHGSRTSSTDAFVQAASPVDAVVSVGRHNTFGHPRAEVIDRFAQHGTHLFRTDEFGLTTFLLTPDGRISERVGDIPLPPR